TLLRVVEDHAERVTEAGGDAADAVTQGHAVRAAGAGDRSLSRREDHDLALLEWNHLAARLRPGPLLDQQELAAGEVRARAAQEAGHLERERDGAVEILMQAVVPAGLVAEQQRGGLALAVRGAGGQEAVEVGRIRGLAPEGHAPRVRDWGQARVGVTPQCRHGR